MTNPQQKSPQPSRPGQRHNQTRKKKPADFSSPSQLQQPARLRGFVSELINNETRNAMVTDMAGSLYFLRESEWLTPDNKLAIGTIVEFTPGVVNKGRAALKARSLTTNSLATPEMDDAWLSLATAEEQQVQERLKYHQLATLVVDRNYAVEDAICEIYGISIPENIEYPERASLEDKEFVTAVLPTSLQSKRHSTAKRLTRTLSLDSSHLLGFLRGKLSYRVALERSLKNRTDQVSDRVEEAEMEQQLQTEVENDSSLNEKSPSLLQTMINWATKSR